VSDLAARLRAVVEERLAVARAAALGRWSNMRGYAYDAFRDDSVAAHIALNDPADVILACERDRAVLERHAPVEGRRGGLMCSEAVGGDDFYAPDWPCDEIRDLATRYQVEVE